MKALIDGDILLYELGGCTDDEGHPISWPLTKTRVDGKIHQITNDAGCSNATVYISGTNNFREAEATILPYKGNRKGKEKPLHHKRIKDYLLATKNHTVETYDGYEADDALSMAQRFDWDHSDHTEKTQNTVLCSRDKDLLMVPGKHFIWKSGKQKEQTLFITEVEGIRWFFKQLLMGDKGTDNILGLFGVGPKSTLVTALDGMDLYQDMYNHVWSKYYDRFGEHWKLFMHENARLLWMLRHEDDDIRHQLTCRDAMRRQHILNAEDY